MKKKFLTMKFLVVMLSLVLILILTGCGANKTPESNSTAEKPAANPIVIGAPLPTGFLYGWDAERAMTLAVEEINAKGGVSVGSEKRPLKLEVLDTRDLEPAVPVSDALLAVEKLILEKKADFIVGGPARSEAALAAMDQVANQKKVFIATTGFLSPAFEDKVAKDYEKYKTSFRITGTSKTMVGEMLAVFDSFKEKHGFSKAAIMVQDVAHARAGGEIMAKQLKTKGWDVMNMEIYPTGTGDFSSGLLKAKNFGAQVLFIWMDMPESSILLKQYSDMKLPALPYGFIEAAEQPGFAEAAQGKGEFTLVHLVNAGNAPANVGTLTEDFANNYKKRWNIETEGYGTSSSYQAIYTLVDAIQRAGSTDTEAVIKALEQSDLMGVYGKIKFNQNHQVVASMDPAEGAVPQVIQWQNGKRVTVFPEKIATAPLQLPPWMNK